MTALERLQAPGKKKLLALDGGGIRGALSVEILAGLEAMLRRTKNQPKLVLADYFDFIGGTSTGAILAASLSFGKSVDELRTFYESSGPAMFDKASLLERFRYKYKDEELSNKLKSVFGENTLFGSEKLRTLLLMVMRNATTDSPWPLSNNPRAKFNQPGVDGNNLRLPLWQLIRASTAAPVYFPPETIQVGSQAFLFVDGGITMYNNPAFQMFLMSTIPAYQMEWKTGEEDLLIVSVGTGYAPEANKNLQPSEMNLLYNASSIPSALMAAALHEQDTLCRVFGKCLMGNEVDLELGDLKGMLAPGGKNLFTYLRYNAELTTRGLAQLKLPNIDPKKVQQLDSIDGIAELQQIGRAVAQSIDPNHYVPFL
jgi:uncharacterized protein